MPIFEIFSKRQKKLRGDVPDIYTYDVLPNNFRVQVVHIWMGALGNAEQYDTGLVLSAYQFIVDTLCREYGVFQLAETRSYRRNYLEELVNYFLAVDDTERALDSIELSFRLIDSYTRKYGYLSRTNHSDIADDAIHELNTRFREHGIGYQLSDSEIIRVDSEFIHTKVVKPALRLLNDIQYAGAQQEFLKAHEHYRLRNKKEALNECLKAFESLMKAICDKRCWQYDKTATAKTLIQICLDKDLIPKFWQQHFASLRSLLESSVPTGRNKLSGHGQGSMPNDVPDYLVSYMLHMTASAIVFLAEAERSAP